LAALGLPLYAVVPTYYTEVLGLPLGGVGIVLLLVRIFDAVADPLVSGWRPIASAAASLAAATSRRRSGRWQLPMRGSRSG
jgi:Na+/melibiose symporter-like transporter